MNAYISLVFAFIAIIASLVTIITATLKNKITSSDIIGFIISTVILIASIAMAIADIAMIVR